MKTNPVYKQVEAVHERMDALIERARTSSRDPLVLETIEELSGVLEELEANEIAQQQANELNTVFDALRQPVIVFDASGKPVKVNPAARFAFGMDVTTMDVEHFQELSAKEFLSRPDGQALTVQELPSRRALRGETVRDERFAFHARGNILTLEISATPLCREGKVMGAVVVWHDVTEREGLMAALAREKATLEAVIRQMPAGVVIAEAPSGKIVMVNEHMSTVMGQPFIHKDSVEQYVQFKAFHPDGRFYQPQDWPLARAVRNEAMVFGEEMQILRPDGAMSTLIAFSSPIRDAQARTIAGVATFVDITDRKRAENYLRESQQRLRTTFASLREAVFIVELDTAKILDCNPAACDIFGYSREEMMAGTTLMLHIDEGKMKEFRDILNSAAADRGFLELSEFKMRRKSGEIFLTEHSVAPLDDNFGRRIGWVSVIRDITERKRMEEELLKSRDDLEIRVQKRTAELARANEELKAEITERSRTETALQESDKQLRDLYSQLEKIEESERKRIARELHDGLGQALTAMKFKVESYLQGIAHRRSREKAKSLESVVQMIQECVREIHRIQTNLRPSMIDDLGIVATVSWLTREFEETFSGVHHLEKRIEIEEEQVPEPLKMVIYRILQEALNNISKHSRADRILLSFLKTDGSIVLSLRDNGQGFNIQEAMARERPRKGVGLASMKERVEYSGGSFMIESIPGKGTTLRASWPL